VAALVGLVASTTIASFQAERHRVVASLRAAAQVSADKVAEQNRQTLEYMAAYGHLYTFTSGGTPICSQGAPGLDGMASRADWQSALTQGKPIMSGPRRDPATGKVVTVLAVPVRSPDGRAGAMVAVFFSSALPIDVPGDLPRATGVLQLASGRGLVVGASADAAPLIGRPTSGSGLERPVPDAGATVTGFDHGARFAVEVTASDGTHIAVMVPPAVVTAGAWQQLRRNLGLGAVLAVLLAGLGLLPQRRLARPMRRITSAIRAAVRL